MSSRALSTSRILVIPSASFHRSSFRSPMSRDPIVILYDYLDDLRLGTLECSVKFSIVHVHYDLVDIFNTSSAYTKFCTRLREVYNLVSFGGSGYHDTIFLCVSDSIITQILLSAPAGVHVDVIESDCLQYLFTTINRRGHVDDPVSILEFFGFNYGDISVGESNRVSKWDGNHHTYRIWFKRFFGHLLYFTGGICLGILLFLIFFMLSWPLFFDWEMLL